MRSKAKKEAKSIKKVDNKHSLKKEKIHKPTKFKKNKKTTDNPDKRALIKQPMSTNSKKNILEQPSQLHSLMNFHQPLNPYSMYPGLFRPFHGDKNYPLNMPNPNFQQRFSYPNYHMPLMNMHMPNFAMNDHFRQHSGRFGAPDFFNYRMTSEAYSDFFQSNQFNSNNNNKKNAESTEFKNSKNDGTVKKETPKKSKNEEKVKNSNSSEPSTSTNLSVPEKVSKKTNQIFDDILGENVSSKDVPSAKNDPTKDKIDKNVRHTNSHFNAKNKNFKDSGNPKTQDTYKYPNKYPYKYPNKYQTDNSKTHNRQQHQQSPHQTHYNENGDYRHYQPYAYRPHEHPLNEYNQRYNNNNNNNNFNNDSNFYGKDYYSKKYHPYDDPNKMRTTKSGKDSHFYEDSSDAARSIVESGKNIKDVTGIRPNVHIKFSENDQSCFNVNADKETTNKEKNHTKDIFYNNKNATDTSKSESTKKTKDLNDSNTSVKIQNSKSGDTDSNIDSKISSRSSSRDDSNKHRSANSLNPSTKPDTDKSPKSKTDPKDKPTKIKEKCDDKSSKLKNTTTSTKSEQNKTKEPISKKDNSSKIEKELSNKSEINKISTSKSNYSVEISKESVVTVKESNVDNKSTKTEIKKTKELDSKDDKLKSADKSILNSKDNTMFKKELKKDADADSDSSSSSSSSSSSESSSESESEKSKKLIKSKINLSVTKDTKTSIPILNLKDLDVVKESVNNDKDAKVVTKPKTPKKLEKVTKTEPSTNKKEVNVKKPPSSTKKKKEKLTPETSTTSDDATIKPTSAKQELTSKDINNNDKTSPPTPPTTTTTTTTSSTKKPLTKTELLKLVSSPRSRRDQIQMDRLMKEYSEKNKSSTSKPTIPDNGFEIPFSLEHLDLANIDIKAIKTDVPDEVSDAINDVLNFSSTVLDPIVLSDCEDAKSIKKKVKGPKAVKVSTATVTPKIRKRKATVETAATSAENIIDRLNSLTNDLSPDVADISSTKTKIRRKSVGAAATVTTASEAGRGGGVVNNDGTVDGSNNNTNRNTPNSSENILETLLEISLKEDELHYYIQQTDYEIQHLQSCLADITQKLNTKKQFKDMLLEEEKRLKTIRIQALKDSVSNSNTTTPPLQQQQPSTSALLFRSTNPVENCNFLTGNAGFINIEPNNNDNDSSDDDDSNDKRDRNRATHHHQQQQHQHQQQIFLNNNNNNLSTVVPTSTNAGMQVRYLGTLSGAAILKKLGHDGNKANDNINLISTTNNPAKNSQSEKPASKSKQGVRKGGQSPSSSSSSSDSDEDVGNVKKKVKKK